MLPIPWAVMPSGLHRTYGAHHLHFITCSCYRRLPLLNSARARDRLLSILEQTRQRYRFVVVGYVVMPEHIHLLMTEPEVGNPSTVMASTQAAHGAGVVAEEKAARSAATNSVRGRSRPSGFLAGTLLRLQRLDNEEASGKAEVHASQSRETATGGVARAMAMEQLPVLFARRGRSGAGERGVVGDLVSESSCLKVSRDKNLTISAASYPPLQKTQGRGTPLYCWC